MACSMRAASVRERPLVVAAAPRSAERVARRSSVPRRFGAASFPRRSASLRRAAEGPASGAARRSSAERNCGARRSPAEKPLVAGCGMLARNRGLDAGIETVGVVARPPGRALRSSGAEVPVPGALVGAGVYGRMRTEVPVVVTVLAPLDARAGVVGRVGVVGRITTGVELDEERLGTLEREDDDELGRTVGRELGEDDGRAAGGELGLELGRAVGRELGRDDGWAVGRELGREVGRALGEDEGRALGRELWASALGAAGTRRARSASRLIRSRMVGAPGGGRTPPSVQPPCRGPGGLRSARAAEASSPVDSRAGCYGLFGTTSIHPPSSSIR